MQNGNPSAANALFSSQRNSSSESNVSFDRCNELCCIFLPAEFPLDHAAGIFAKLPERAGAIEIVCAREGARNAVARNLIEQQAGMSAPDVFRKIDVRAY